MISLTTEQFAAVKLIKSWFCSSDNKIPFILAGLAGTGKTTIITHITNELKIKDHQIRYCAFTGKASLVMQSKGMDATTIHSLIYEPRTDKNGVVFFVKRYSLGIDVKLIICDESSMIGKDIQRDLESFGIPILYVGDHCQLPPVSDDITNLMLTPNYKLETIHRQALDNPIIWVANQARLGKFIKFGKYGSTVLKTTSDKINISSMKSANQIICGKNITRRHINKQMREYYEFNSEYPQVNDKLICLRNNRDSGLINGMTGVCTKFDNKKFRLDFLSDTIQYKNLKIDPNIFENTHPIVYNKKIEQFDYGYAITCHKSQGSQYDNVIVYEERLGFDKELHHRWLYTAITRSSEKLIIIS